MNKTAKLSNQVLHTSDPQTYGFKYDTNGGCSIIKNLTSLHPCFLGVTL